METSNINSDLRGGQTMEELTEYCISQREIKIFICLSAFQVSAVVHFCSTNSRTTAPSHLMISYDKVNYLTADTGYV